MRYRIVIADDEPIICNMLARLIHFDSLNLELAGQAYSGGSLLALIEETSPDIVLTDINMPTINGIEVIRRVVESGRKCSFVTISGYREFEYVYNALKYNVKDYLLKPITEEDLNATLSKLVEQLDANGRSSQESMRSVWYYYMTAGLEEFEKKSFTIQRLNELLGSHFAQGPFRCMLIRTDFTENIPEISENSSFINSKIRDILELHLGPVTHDMLLADLRYEMRCVMNYDGQMSAAVLQALRESFSQLKNLTASLNGISVTFCLSGEDEDTGRLPHLFAQAEELVWRRLISGVNALHVYSPPSPLGLLMSEKLDLLKKRVDKAFEILSVEDFTGCMDELFSIPRPTLAHTDFIAFIRGIPDRFFELASDRMTAVENIDFAKTELNNVLDMAYSLTAYKNALVSKIGALLTLIREDVDRQNVKPVRQAISYINTHYSQPIRLDDLAAQIGLSPVYLSTLFKKETGVSFTDYLIDLRLAKAKELLADTNLTVSEIAWKCGFSEPRYFSRVFKKSVGVKPTEYRRIY